MRYFPSEDVANIIVSYPRTGTTWLEALAGAYLRLAYDLPEELTMRLQELTRAGGLPVLMITHDPQRLDAEPPAIAEDYAARRVVLNLRDPRDALVSLYLFNRYRRRLVAEEVLLGDYVREELPRLLGFYEAWLSEAPETFDGFAITTYEALHQGARLELVRLVDFFHYKWDNAALEGAVQFASFASMKELEQNGRLSEFYRVPGIEPHADERAMRARRGKVGGYVDYLDATMLAWVNEQIAAAPHVAHWYA